MPRLNFCGAQHHRGDTCVAFAAIPATCGRRCRRMDFQQLGFSRYPQRFLPGQSCRTIGGAVGSRILSSHFDSAAVADYARTRFPNSSPTSTRTPKCKKAGTQHKALGHCEEAAVAAARTDQRDVQGCSFNAFSSAGAIRYTGPFQYTGIGPSPQRACGAYRTASSQ